MTERSPFWSGSQPTHWVCGWPGAEANDVLTIRRQTRTYSVWLIRLCGRCCGHHFILFLSGRLMLLSYTGSRSGRQYMFAVGYFSWDSGDVLAFSSGKWPQALGAAGDVRVLIRGVWY